MDMVADSPTPSSPASGRVFVLMTLRLYAVTLTNHSLDGSSKNDVIVSFPKKSRPTVLSKRLRMFSVDDFSSIVTSA